MTISKTSPTPEFLVQTSICSEKIRLSAFKEQKFDIQLMVIFKCVSLCRLLFGFVEFFANITFFFSPTYKVLQLP